MGVFIYDIAPLAMNEAAREAAVTASGTLSMMAHPALAPLVKGAAEALGTRFATISIVVRDWQYLIAAHGLPTGVTRRSSAFCAHAVLRPDEPFVVLDARTDDRFAANPNVVEAPAIRFYAGAALRQDPDVALGTLCVFDPYRRTVLRRDEARELVRRAAEATALIGEITAGIQRRRSA